MKRVFILSCFFIMISHLLSAQTSKGSMMLGGSVSFGKETNDYANSSTYESSSFTFSPSFGYFLADNIMIGANFGLMTQATTQGEGRSDYFGISGGPMFRWYKATSNEKFFFFAQASLSLGRWTRNDDNGFNETEYSGSSFNLNISPGFAYFLNEHWSAELSVTGIGYSRYAQELASGDGENVNSNFNFSVHSFTPWIGIRYYF